MRKHPATWVLIDDRAGNTSQTIGLAEAIGIPYQIKKITYNKFSYIPNIFIGASLLTITEDSKKQLIAPYPEVIISSGRRLAPIARYLKKQNPSIKLFHMMWPEAGIKDFDLIITPSHDKRIIRSNMVETIGSIHNVNSQVLSQEVQKFMPQIEGLPRPYISVLIGGNSKTGCFTKDNAEIFIDYINNLQETLKATILVTTSRRTSKDVIELISANLNEPNYIYSYNISSNEKNPYMGMIGVGDVIIVTGDSISMCSEACYTGKPVYVYSDKEFCSSKHLLFHKQIFDLNLAKDIRNIEGDNIFQIDNKLNEVYRIAEYIKNKFSDIY
ncbi:MAG: mitochondrial fission ELM1 family protein [Alphaproteobacteria bacterium]